MKQCCECNFYDENGTLSVIQLWSLDSFLSVLRRITDCEAALYWYTIYGIEYTHYGGFSSLVYAHLKPRVWKPG